MLRILSTGYVKIMEVINVLIIFNDINCFSYLRYKNNHKKGISLYSLSADFYF